MLVIAGVGVEIAAGRVDDDLAQQARLSELMQGVIDRGQRDRKLLGGDSTGDASSLCQLDLDVVGPALLVHDDIGGRRDITGCHDAHSDLTGRDSVQPERSVCRLEQLPQHQHAAIHESPTARA